MTYKLIFGVFDRTGRIVMALGKTRCTHRQAAIVVGILDLAKDALEPGHYFACDYTEGK